MTPYLEAQVRPALLCQAPVGLPPGCETRLARARAQWDRALLLTRRSNPPPCAPTTRALLELSPSVRSWRVCNRQPATGSHALKCGCAGWQRCDRITRWLRVARLKVCSERRALCVCACARVRVCAWVCVGACALMFFFASWCIGVGDVAASVYGKVDPGMPAPEGSRGQDTHGVHVLWPGVAPAAALTLLCGCGWAVLTLDSYGGVQQRGQTQAQLGSVQGKCPSCLALLCCWAFGGSGSAARRGQSLRRRRRSRRAQRI
jgi:hypothetical protein